MSIIKSILLVSAVMLFSLLVIEFIFLKKESRPSVVPKESRQTIRGSHYSSETVEGNIRYLLYMLREGYVPHDNN